MLNIKPPRVSIDYSFVLQGLVLNDESTCVFGENSIYLLRMSVQVTIKTSSTLHTVKTSKSTHMLILTEGIICTEDLT